MEELKNALQFAKERDRSVTGGKHPYTCPILDHYHYDYSDCRPLGSIEACFKDELRDDKCYEPIRDREDFKALLD